MSKLIIHTIAINAAKEELYKSQLQGKEPSSSGIILRSGQYPVYVKKLQQGEVGKKWQDVQDESWQFPIDPIISISGKNIITKRNVCKTNQNNWRGSIKELWSQDDYNINITGIFVGETAENDIAKLKDLINYQGDVYLHCNIFEQLDIYSLVIESFDIKETFPGRYEYSLKCLSDDAYELLIED